MSGMMTYRLPHTDFDVSRIAYGTWHLGGSWDDVPLDDEIKSHSDRMLHLAAELGINFIDLADIYVLGKSDEAVGHVLAGDSTLRDKFMLQAKCGIQIGGRTAAEDPGRYNFEFDHIVSAVEGTCDVCRQIELSCCCCIVPTRWSNLKRWHAPSTICTRPEKCSTLV